MKLQPAWFLPLSTTLGALGLRSAWIMRREGRSRFEAWAMAGLCGFPLLMWALDQWRHLE